MLHTANAPLLALRSGALRGTVRVPGDKSISHRALLLGALASGRTRIRGLLQGEDVLNTGRALTAMGCPVRPVEGAWEVLGRGVGGLAAPAAPLNFGNSGTGVRLMMGVVAGNDILVSMVGDASLSRRPMGRVLEPLVRMGAEVVEGARTLPLSLHGTGDLLPIEYELPVASAAALSAIVVTSALAWARAGLSMVTTLVAPSADAAFATSPTPLPSTARMTSPPPCFAEISLAAATATPTAFGILPWACSA